MQDRPAIARRCPDCGSPAGEWCITSGGRPAKKMHFYRLHPSGDAQPLMYPATQVAAALLAGRRLTDDQEAVYRRSRAAVDMIMETNR